MLMRFDTSNLFLFGTNICALQNRTAKKKRERERERGGGEGREEKKEEKSQAISPARSIRSARFGNRALGNCARLAAQTTAAPCRCLGKIFVLANIWRLSTASNHRAPLYRLLHLINDVR